MPRRQTSTIRITWDDGNGLWWVEFIKIARRRGYATPTDPLAFVRKRYALNVAAAFTAMFQPCELIVHKKNGGVQLKQPAIVEGQ